MCYLSEFICTSQHVHRKASSWNKSRAKTTAETFWNRSYGEGGWGKLRCAPTNTISKLQALTYCTVATVAAAREHWLLSTVETLLLPLSKLSHTPSCTTSSQPRNNTATNTCFATVLSHCLPLTIISPWDTQLTYIIWGTPLSKQAHNNNNATSVSLPQAPTRMYL